MEEDLNLAEKMMLKGKDQKQILKYLVKRGRSQGDAYEVWMMAQRRIELEGTDRQGWDKLAIRNKKFYVRIIGTQE